MYSISGLDVTLATRHDIASQQVDVLGEIPSEWRTSWEKRHKHFEDIKRPQKNRSVFPSLEQNFEENIQAKATDVLSSDWVVTW
ncbi:hypothetical protein ASPNIDRAFT_137153 [Aspergillus niger ATCC 1015]|uniref:Uncharacterized protein n=2 Tax=Aspergillus niger TaxID=5061 RepID=G3Y6E6_ASPNA|nr:hypothetical protein ASPNIDRAFT_137153 [Aspergillus niger ATCC 1015]